MKKYITPSWLAAAYTAASVLVGPLIFLLGFKFTRGGGDYCDAVYYSAGIMDPHRDIEFLHAQIFQVTGASIMLAVGAGLIISLFIHAAKHHEPINYWALLGVVIMMFGYVGVILMSGKGAQVC